MILVTGASGFVGSVLLPALVARGERVSALARRPLTARSGAEERRGDLLDPASLTTALRDVGTVIHLAAALPATGVDDAAMTQINVDGTRNLAIAATVVGATRLILVSSAGVYGDRAELQPPDEQVPPTPTTTYERSKLEAERVVAAALRDSGTSSVILRPTGIHGPGRDATLQFYKDISRRRVWLHSPSRVILQPTYVGDVVRAILLSLDCPTAGGIFNIGGAETLEYPALIDRIARRMHVRTRQIQVPAQPTRMMAKAAAALARAMGRPVPTLERLQQPVITRMVDTSRARQTLGFEPYPLDEAIDATIAWARRERRL